MRLKGLELPDVLLRNGLLRFLQQLSMGKLRALRLPCFTTSGRVRTMSDDVSS